MTNVNQLDNAQAQKPTTSRSFSTRVFEGALSLYRQTFKRVHIFHVAIHWIISHSVIPFLEYRNKFKTISDDPFWFRLELLLNKHEAETVQCIHSILQPDMVVLDIGAHVGYYARLFSGIVGQNGTVIAFEPHPQTFAHLQQNVVAFSNIQSYRKAISSENGTAELYDYLMMSASGSLHFDESLRELEQAQLSEYDVAPRKTKDFHTQTFEVETVRLDDFLPEQGISQIDFIKMDIEGAEMEALRGAQTMISQSSTLKLIMEYNPQALAAFDLDPQAAIQEVLGMGFTTVYSIQADGQLNNLTNLHSEINELTNDLNQNMGVVNLLFTKE